MKMGDRVLTPDGFGTVKGFEPFRSGRRIIVKLDINPYSYELAGYYFTEVKKLKT